MAFEPSLFSRYRHAAKLPNNRREGSRRSGTSRRSDIAEIVSDRRSPSDRRGFDRRRIVVEAYSSKAACQLWEALVSRDAISKMFPQVHHLRSETDPSLIDISIPLEGESIRISAKVEYDREGMRILVKKIDGDIKTLSAEIEVIPEVDGSKIRVSASLEVGLPSFEAFMGSVFKGIIEAVLRRGLDRFIDSIEEVSIESDFGFVVHTIPDYFNKTFRDESYNEIPKPLFRYLLKELPPFKCARVTGVQSTLGPTTVGDLIYSPYAPSHFLELPKGDLLRHIIEAGEIAKALGAKVLGLGAYTAFVGKRGVEIEEALGIPVTTGTSYTIATAVKALENAADEMNVPMESSTVVVVGASGSIGQICAELLAAKAKNLILVARNNGRLATVAERIKKTSQANVTFTNDLNASMAKGDYVLISTNSPEQLNVASIKAGAVVCDISQPRNISFTDAMSRPDILVIDGGVVQPPGKPNFNFYFGLPEGLSYACIAETMILALERRYESFSLGGKITTERVREIYNLGLKHGFKVAELKSFGQMITNEKFTQLSKVRLAAV